MGTFKRIKRAIKAEINYSSNNPEKITSQNIKELEATIVRLRRLITQAYSSIKRIQDKYDYSVSEAITWQKRAWLAVYANDDYLAKEALLRKKHFEQEAVKLEIQIKSDRNTETINNLRQKLTAIEMRVTELKLLEARQYSSKAQRILQTSMSEINTSSAMGAFERIEEKVIQIDAESEVATDLSNIDIEEQFSDLWALENNDDEIVVMKAQLPNTPIKEIEAVNNNIPYYTTPIDAELEELRSQLNG